MRSYFIGLPLLFFLAACGSGGAPESGVYIALGDSLSEGVGASDRSTTGFVPLVHQGLGDGIELMNLGESGDTSGDLLRHGHLERAAAEVGRRNSDDDPDNDVLLVTLEIGGNDLLRLFGSLVLTGNCTTIRQSLAKPECVDSLRAALNGFSSDLSEALDRLQEADAGLTIVVMTLYNPLSGVGALPFVGDFEDLAELALEGQPGGPFPEGLNDIVRSEAAERDLILVDWYPLFEGRAGQYIASDFIHPNDRGYEVMAEAILEAVR